MLLIHTKVLSILCGVGGGFIDQLCGCVNMEFGYLCCRCVGNTSR